MFIVFYLCLLSSVLHGSVVDNTHTHARTHTHTDISMSGNIPILNDDKDNSQTQKRQYCYYRSYKYSIGTLQYVHFHEMPHPTAISFTQLARCQHRYIISTIPICLWMAKIDQITPLWTTEDHLMELVASIQVADLEIYLNRDLRPVSSDGLGC